MPLNVVFFCAAFYHCASATSPMVALDDFRCPVGSHQFGKYLDGICLVCFWYWTGLQEPTCSTDTGQGMSHPLRLRKGPNVINLPSLERIVSFSKVGCCFRQQSQSYLRASVAVSTCLGNVRQLGGQPPCFSSCPHCLLSSMV